MPRSPSAAALVVLAVLAVLPRPAAARSPGAADPDRDRLDREAAATCLALLRHERTRCREIAEAVEAYWVDLGSMDPSAAEERVRTRVLERHAGELAEGRAAGAEARTVLGRLRSGPAHEVVATLQRLSDLETARCDLVALPTAPRTRFSARLAELRGRVEAEEKVLGRSLEVEEGELADRILPFLPRLQIAGVEAEGELDEHRRSQVPPPPPPDPAAPMKRWHRSYVGLATPTKAALGRYLRSRNGGDGKGIAAACRDLVTEVPKLIEGLDLHRAPDERATRTLAAAFRDLRELGLHCVAGRQREADEAFRRFQASLGEAAVALGRWELTP